MESVKDKKENVKNNKPKTEKVEIEDEDLYSFVKGVSSKANKEISQHVRKLPKGELWDLNKKDIFNEIIAAANAGITQASIYDIRTVVDGEPVILKSQEGFTPIIEKLSSLRFGANIRYQPITGFFIAVTWA